MSPEPLREPPADYGELAARFPVLAKDRIPRPVVRIHRLDRDPEWFSFDGTRRWDPPSTHGPSFGTCYLAANPATAFVEVFGDVDRITLSMVEARCLAKVELRDDLKLADMTARQILGDWGLDQRICVGEDYAICQRWAEALQLAGFSGIFYTPRHDLNPGVDDRSVGLFGDSGHQPTQLSVLEDGIGIDADLLREVQRDFGIRVLPTAPLI